MKWCLGPFFVLVMSWGCLPCLSIMPSACSRPGHGGPTWACGHQALGIHHAIYTRDVHHYDTRAFIKMMHGLSTARHQDAHHHHIRAFIQYTHEGACVGDTWAAAMIHEWPCHASGGVVGTTNQRRVQQATLGVCAQAPGAFTILRTGPLGRWATCFLLP